MSEICQRCNAEYSYVYRVPNWVWAKIAPNKENLGDYPEHQYGGLLCLPCAHHEAVEQGISLYFDGSAFGWTN